MIRKIVALLAVTAIGVAASILIFSSSPTRDAEGVDLFPNSMEEVIRGSDIIFYGEVKNSTYLGVSTEGYVETTPGVFRILIDPTPNGSPGPPSLYVTTTPYHYILNPSANGITPNASPGVSNVPYATTGTYPLSVYEIEVQEIYYDGGGQIAISDTVDYLGGYDSGSYNTPTPVATNDFVEEGGNLETVMPGIGERRLFFLARDHDDRYFSSVFGLYSILDISGSSVLLASSPPFVIDISDATATQDFLGEIQDLIELVY